MDQISSGYKTLVRTHLMQTLALFSTRSRLLFPQFRSLSPRSARSITHTAGVSSCRGGGGMLDINLFRVEKGGDPERVRESQRRRCKDEKIVDEVIALDQAWRRRQFESDQLKKDFNNLTKEIKRLKIAREDATEAVKGTEDHKKKIAEKEEEVKAAKVELDAKIMTIGNLVHDSVPVSDDEVS